MKPSRLALRAALPLALTLYAACGGEEAETADSAAMAIPDSNAVVAATLAVCEEKDLKSETKTIPEAGDYIELAGGNVREVRVAYDPHPGGGNQSHKVEAVSGTAGDVDATDRAGRKMTIAIDTTGCTGSGTFHIYRVTGAALHKLDDTTAPKASMVAGIYDPGNAAAADTGAVRTPPRFAVGTE